MVNGLDSRTAIARLVRPFLRRRNYWTFIHAGMSGISQRLYSMGKNGWASFSDARLDPRYTAIELCFFLEFYESWCLRAPMDMWSHRRMVEWISSFKIFLHFIPSFQHMAGRTGLLYRIYSASLRRYMAWLRRMTMDMELCIYPTDCVSIMCILIQQMQVISFMEHSSIRQVARQMQVSISISFDE